MDDGNRRQSVLTGRVLYYVSGVLIGVAMLILYSAGRQALRSGGTHGQAPSSATSAPGGGPTYGR